MNQESNRNPREKENNERPPKIPLTASTADIVIEKKQPPKEERLDINYLGRCRLKLWKHELELQEAKNYTQQWNPQKLRKIIGNWG